MENILHFLGGFCLGSFLLAGLADTGKALGHILDAVVDILLDIGQRGNSFLQGSLDLIQRLHNVLLDLLRSSAGVLFQFTQHLADLLCVDGQLIRADEHERHDHDDDKFPKTNFHTNSFPFLCGGTFSGADAPALQCVPRTVLCPVLRPLPWEFGALCACVALLIPKSGELILNNI